jgi:tetratricopeptide (TPR) repeat protein
MRGFRTLSTALLAATLMAVGTGCTYLQARDHLNKGINAYRGAKYGEAVEHFKQAMALDPDWLTPRIYLATSYISQWIPGAESPENLEMAKRAREEFQKVLEVDAKESTALGYLAMLSYNEALQTLDPDQKSAKLDEAAEWHNKRIEADPNQKEAYYSLGVIAFQRWNPVWLSARSGLRMKTEDPGPLKDRKVRDDLKVRFTPVLDDGIQNLEKALEIDPEYDDAMAFMNLLIRERADLLDTSDEYTAQIAVADGWLDKALETKKIKAERANKGAGGGIVQEN